MAALTHQPKSTKMLSGRYYSTADFVAALQKELQDSKGEGGTIPVTPKGFALTDKEGYNLVVLKGTFEGESVTVQFSIPKKMEFDTPARGLKVPFDVLVEKQNKGVIEVQCTTDDMGFEIDQLAYFEDKERKIAKEETAEADYQRDLRYAGPNLDDLESSLQSELTKYMESRGITEELSQFIQDYVKNVKEPSEYKRWLNGLHNFVKP
jgi:complement component 1 Q subcomponent-binding protein